ncbi:hypothetical protein MTP99_013728 [Tenebrio molitor]|nr:hypothetical protein MTP99_013728 [Tenebrio molitor]
MRLAPEQTSFAEKKNWKRFAFGVIEAVVPRGSNHGGNGSLIGCVISIGRNLRYNGPSLQFVFILHANRLHPKLARRWLILASD